MYMSFMGGEGFQFGGYLLPNLQEQPLPTYSEFNESQEDAIRLIPTAVRSRKPIGPLGAIGLLPHG